MFTDDSLSQVVIIDFDSTQAPAYVFQPGDKEGTFGWMQGENWKESKDANDLFGLDAVKRYLSDPRGFMEASLKGGEVLERVDGVGEVTDGGKSAREAKEQIAATEGCVKESHSSGLKGRSWLSFNWLGQWCVSFDLFRPSLLCADSTRIFAGCALCNLLTHLLPHTPSPNVKHFFW